MKILKIFIPRPISSKSYSFKFFSFPKILKNLISFPIIKKNNIFHINYLMDNIIKNQNLTVISTESLEFFETNRLNEKHTNFKIVATHSGCFHADEVLSVAMIKYIPEFKNMWVIRSRNKEILDKADIVVDVGGKYDLEKKRFDHHMKEFTHVHDDVYKIKLSSAGLIFKHFGKIIIENFLKELKIPNHTNEIDLIYDKLYYNFIAYVDGQDNGINQYPDDITPKYVNTTSYGNRVSRLNPEWCEPSADQSERFKLALDVAESEFLDQLKFIAKVFLPAYSMVKDAVNKRFEVHPSGKILYFDFGFPWKSHLVQIEEELNIKEQIVFAIVKNGESDYRISTIPINQGSFKFRKGIVQEWRGLELERLAEISGIEDIVFVHNSGFIGGAKSKESVFKIAEISLKEEEIVVTKD